MPMGVHETTGFPINQLPVSCAPLLSPLNIQPMVEMHDGVRLALLMKRSGTSDQTLADAVDASVQAVGKWKRTGNFARERIAPICREISASADELLGLAPISGVSETPARYQVEIDREALHRAVRIVETELSRPETIDLDPDGRAELIMTVYEQLRISASMQDVQSFLSRILKAFASREGITEDRGNAHGAHRRRGPDS